MRKLTKERWARTLAEDLFSVLWLIWKAFVALLTWEFIETLTLLLPAWILVRYEHTVEKIEEDRSSS